MSSVRADVFEQFIPKGKIVEYILVGKEETTSVEVTVYRLLEKGWYLYGPPFSHGIRVVQAMVKIQEK